MAKLQDWDLWRKIQSLLAMQRYLTPQQKERLQALSERYNPSPTNRYKPSREYPKISQRIGAPSKDINLDFDYGVIVKNPEVRARLPKEDWETERSYTMRLKEFVKANSFHNLDREDIAVYNPNPTSGFFKSAPSVSTKRSFVSLDIETDDFGNPISISALKFQKGQGGKGWVSTDNYQRFYLSPNSSLKATQAVHGLTSAKLVSLRRQQGANYGLRYDQKELDALKDFLGDSTIVGHNIVSYDLGRLFPNEVIGNSTIDTLYAARNAWHGKKNDLDHVFYRIFGKTMEQAGLSHHDANADTVASMMIAAAMAEDKGTVGQSIAYIMKAKHPAHMAEYDEMLESMVTRGNYKQMNASNLYEVYMTAKELGLTNADGTYKSGFHEDIPMNIDEKLDSQNALAMVSALAKSIEDVKKMITVQNPDAAQVVREAKSFGVGQGISAISTDLFEAVNQFNNYKKLSLIRTVANAKSAEEVTAIAKASGYPLEGAGWGSIVDLASNWKSVQQRDKKTAYYQKMDEMVADHLLTKEQAAQIKSRQGPFKELSDSYEDLVKATEETVQANQKLANTYRSIASIRPYDINQYVHAAEGQWSGIKGAAHGVIPGFIRNTIGRLGDAAFNSIERGLVPLNAAMRIGNSILGPLSGIGGTGSGGGGGGIGGRLMGTPVGAVFGVASGATQVIGNVAQAKMEMTGLSIQNNLNTLGAMITWISTPFQLLHKALKLVTGALGGFTFKLNSFMGSGISAMSQMGNPLTNLTGVNYSSYAGLSMMDIASLFGKGSMNSTIEDFANQQQALYLGNMDINRVIGASLLGVYNEAYNPNGDAQGQYTTMANKILNTMKTQSPEQRARTMYYSSLIDKNLPHLLQSANVLGVNDINELTNPARRGMYWNPASDREATRFRWTQYEYGASKEQFTTSKMRFADSLWRAGGKKIYSSLNELVDAAATGNWEGALKKASEMWKTFRDKFTEIWDGVKDALAKDGDNDIVKSFKAIGLQIENVMISAGLKILDVWNNLMTMLAEKVQGAVAYLSSIKIQAHLSKDGISFSIDTIDNAKVPNQDAQIYDTRTNNMGKIVSQDAHKGMEGYAMLADVLFGEESSYKKSFLTPADLKSAAFQYMFGPDGKSIDIPEYGLTGFHSMHSEDVDALLDMLGKGETGDAAMRNFRRAAALWRADLNSGEKNYDITGIGSAVKKFGDETYNIASDLLLNKYNENNAKVQIMFKDNTGKKAMIEADSEGNIVTKNMTLLSEMVPKVVDTAVSLVKGGS